MRNLKTIFAASLIFTLVLLPSSGSASAFDAKTTARAVQQTTSALERGYRTGYSDGYQAGYRDSVESAPREFRNKDEYKSADRAYAPAFGTLEDYRDGYRQGFESGYESGYDRRSFDSTVPSGIARRETPDSQNDDSSNNSNTVSSNSSSNSSNNSGGGGRINTSGAVVIPANTVMRVELLTNLSTEASQRGDRFQARVLEPSEYEGAVVDGRVTRVKRPGKLKGSAELQLSFEQIRLPDNRWTNFSAQVVEVVDTETTGAGDVDPEGGVKGKSSTKDDIVKVGAGSAIGAIIGAIAGGGKGAAIGAVIGGAVGTGGAIATRGHEIRLPRGQQLKIRTSNETRF
jgi:hypothetical protein